MRCFAPWGMKMCSPGRVRTIWSFSVISASPRMTIQCSARLAALITQTLARKDMDHFRFEVGGIAEDFEISPRPELEGVLRRLACLALQEFLVGGLHFFGRSGLKN